MQVDHERIPLGYRLKQLWKPQVQWCDFASLSVELVCSVSRCLAEFAPEPEGVWNLNGAGLLDHEDVAASRSQLDPSAAYRLLAFELVPFRLDADGQEEPVTVDEVLFAGGGRPRPERAEGYSSLGFDVVNAGPGGFECSPLSCNGLAGEASVNHLCLLGSLPEALEVCRMFAAQEPEPGPFYVVEVLAKDVAQ